MADEKALLRTEQLIADVGDGEAFLYSGDLRPPRFRVEAHIPHCSDGRPGHSWSSFADSGSMEQALIDLERYKREHPTADRWGIAKIEYVTRHTLVHLDRSEQEAPRG